MIETARLRVAGHGCNGAARREIGKPRAVAWGFFSALFRRRTLAEANWEGPIVSDNLRKLEADKARRNTVAESHKFGVGTFVSLIGRAEQATFKITRQLPDGGSGPQYRIKSEREDYERVAFEALLNPVRK
jgi:hypothetical protein